MFRPNDSHVQTGLFDTVKELPERIRQRLEQSWAGTFYREVFCRIKESRFAKLYADEPSRSALKKSPPIQEVGQMSQKRAVFEVISLVWASWTPKVGRLPYAFSQEGGFSEAS